MPHRIQALRRPVSSKAASLAQTSMTSHSAPGPAPISHNASTHQCPRCDLRSPPCAPLRSLRASSPRRPANGWWSKLGPGFDHGRGGRRPQRHRHLLPQAGAQLGYGVGWTLLLTFPLMMGIQLASARIGRVTGKNLTETFARFCPRWMVASAGAVAAGRQRHQPRRGPERHGRSSAALVLQRPCGLVCGGVRPLVIAPSGLHDVCTLRARPQVADAVAFAYVGVVFAVDVDWAAAMRGVFAPSFHWSRDYVTTVVAILGTTISP